MDDLERYKEKINQVEDSSLESTRNMLAMMEEVRGRQKKMEAIILFVITDPGHGGGHTADAG